MAGSVLVHGGNRPNRLEILLKKVNDVFGKNNVSLRELEKFPDFLSVKTEKGKKSIGISQIRKATGFLSEKPFNQRSKVVVIFSGEKLTREAQNALLKTLEEPPSYANIFLESKTEKDLLETVVSRCKKVDARYKQSKVQKTDKDTLDTAETSTYKKALSELEDIVKLVNLSVGKRLVVMDYLDTSDRDLLVETLEKWVMDLRDEMLENPQNNYQNHLRLMVKCIKDLEKTNVSGKFAIETLLINL